MKSLNLVCLIFKSLLNKWIYKYCFSKHNMKEGFVPENQTEMEELIGQIIKILNNKYKS